jgi:hypothetical protein
LQRTPVSGHGGTLPARADSDAVFRLAGGEDAEQWEQLDRLALLQQLGVLPTPGQAPPQAQGIFEQLRTTHADEIRALLAEEPVGHTGTLDR